MGKVGSKGLVPNLGTHSNFRFAHERTKPLVTPPEWLMMQGAGRGAAGLAPRTPVSAYLSRRGQSGPETLQPARTNLSRDQGAASAVLPAAVCRAKPVRRLAP
jgi:hypothetical protein